MAAGKGREPGRDILSAMQGECGQLQPCDPSFGAALEGKDISGGKMESHHGLQKGLGFAGLELQIGGTQFGQVSTSAQASQRQRRIGAGSQHQMELRRQVLEEER